MNKSEKDVLFFLLNKLFELDWFVLSFSYRWSWKKYMAMLETVSKRGCMIYKQEAHEPQRPPEYQRHRKAAL